MRAFNPVGLVSAAIAVGATTPAPSASLPAIVWSSTASCPLAWNGSAWQLIVVSGVITDSTTARTLTVADNGQDITFTNAGSITVTIPTTLGTNFRCNLWQGAAGQITLAKDASFSWVCKSTTPKSSGAGSCVTVVQTASTQLNVTGDYL